MSTPKTPDATLVSALRLLATDIRSSEGLAEGVLHEAADRIEELSEAVNVLHELLHQSQAVFVPSNDGAHKLNFDALVKYAPLTEPSP